VIAGLAFVQGRSNRAGIRAITAASSKSPLSAAVEPSGGNLSNAQRGGVQWELINVGGERYELVNRGNLTAHVRVFGLGTGARMKLRSSVPGDVQPGEAVVFDWVKSWGEPTAVSYSVQWTDDASPAIGQWETLPVSR
jgi:hypothetical protein